MVAVKLPCRENKDVGLSPAVTKKQKNRRWPNSPTGHEWKTSKMIAEPRLYKNRKQNLIKCLTPITLCCFDFTSP